MNNIIGLHLLRVTLQSVFHHQLKIILLRDIMNWLCILMKHTPNAGNAHFECSGHFWWFTENECDLLQIQSVQPKDLQSSWWKLSCCWWPCPSMASNFKVLPRNRKLLSGYIVQSALMFSYFIRLQAKAHTERHNELIILGDFNSNGSMWTSLTSLLNPLQWMSALPLCWIGYLSLTLKRHSRALFK